MSSGQQLFPETELRRPLVITGCSARKRFPPSASLADLPVGPQRAVASAWMATLENAEPVGTADEVYCGRAFSTAVAASKVIGADLLIISAGLGPVALDTRIPSYDLTLGRGGIREAVTGPFDPASWWKTISCGRFAINLEQELDSRPVVLACLSHAYAPLIAPALKKVPLGLLRIFGAGLSKGDARTLIRSVLPYDERLGNSGFSGTRADFAQRALIHYVKTIYRRGASIEDDRESVLQALKPIPHPDPVPKRPSVDDATIRAAIAKLLPAVGPRPSAMLRYLRDVEKVACEQRRFNRLFAEMRHK